VALQALTNLGPAEQPPLAVFSGCTRRYWVDMWSAHRIPQLHFSAFQTRPLLLYSSNYSVYPITSLPPYILYKCVKKHVLQSESRCCTLATMKPTTHSPDQNRPYRLLPFPYTVLPNLSFTIILAFDAVITYAL
jgi:hypothetical protein